jgi:hypothetical protein
MTLVHFRDDGRQRAGRRWALGAARLVCDGNVRIVSANGTGNPRIVRVLTAPVDVVLTVVVPPVIVLARYSVSQVPLAPKLAPALSSCT